MNLLFTLENYLQNRIFIHNINYMMFSDVMKAFDGVKTSKILVKFLEAS